RLYYVCNSPNTASGQCSKNIYYRAEAVDSIVWSFVQDLMNNPTALLEGYKQAQQHTNSQHERTLQELELVNAEIADYSEQLSSILDQRAKAKVKLLIDTLDQRAENVAMALERLEDKRIKLIEKSTDAVITDEQIAAIAEFVADVKDELEDINASNDYTAKRMLIDALNIRVSLRTDEHNEKWVDIHWLIKTYPTAMSVKDGPASRLIRATCTG
ncbi:MAG: hypothetical protein M3R24_01790, partial [Chloroflexota bacterium]|nr:hypothetical protein [Chloroflexota bacterium]